MTTACLAEFGDPEACLAAVERLRRQGFAVHDALTPFPLPELAQALGQAGATPHLRGIMAAAGFGMAGVAFAVQYYSAVDAYPINEGGRPLDSWPVFLLVPFEVGILAAAVAGFAVFLFACGLPRLHHPLFALPNIERASQDRFFLAVSDPAAPADGQRLRRLLAEAGALSVAEVGP